MVCLANFLQAKSDSVSSKVLCVCLPISTFAALGLEHSVVNMSILTMCLFLDGSAFSVGNYFKNIFLSAIGNMIGAIITMTLPAYYTLWLRWKKEGPDTPIGPEQIPDPPAQEREMKQHLTTDDQF
jgi:nitrite transporter NirC